MKTTYLLKLGVNLSGMLPSVKSLTDEINSCMNGFGFPEKIIIHSTLPLTATFEKELTAEEEHTLVRETLKTMNTLHPKWQTTIEAFEQIS